MSADFYIAIYCLALANFCTILMIHMPIIRVANYLDRQQYYSASSDRLVLKEKYRKFLTANQRRFVWKGWKGVKYELVSKEVGQGGRDGEGTPTQNLSVCDTHMRGIGRFSCPEGGGEEKKHCANFRE